jgi:hypothetical protein
MRNTGLVALALAASLVAACETVEGYRQQMASWQGRMGDDLLIDWGPPDERTSLSDGRILWSYRRDFTTQTGGYYRDETRNVTRTYTDKDGQKRTETISETFPVWEPPTTRDTWCATRFILSPTQRIEQVSFDGPACVAAERNG